MGNIKKIIRLKLFEISLSVLFVFLGTFVWISWRESDAYQLLTKQSIPSSYAYVETLVGNVELFPMNDEMALSVLMPNKVKMVNDTYLDTKYALGIRVFKTSTLDYVSLKISLYGKVEYLKDYYFKEDDEYYYFLLDKGNIQADTVSYSVKLWLDIESSSDTNGKVFEYEFVNLESDEI